MVINKKDNKIYNIFFKTLLLIVMAVMFITVSGTSAYAKTVLSKSQTKKYIDKIAATFILQTYLDRRNNG